MASVFSSRSDFFDQLLGMAFCLHIPGFVSRYSACPPPLYSIIVKDCLDFGILTGDRELWLTLYYKILDYN